MGIEKKALTLEYLQYYDKKLKEYVGKTVDDRIEQSLKSREGINMGARHTANKVNNMEVSVSSEMDEVKEMINNLEERFAAMSTQLADVAAAVDNLVKEAEMKKPVEAKKEEFQPITDEEIVDLFDTDDRFRMKKRSFERRKEFL